MYVFQVIHIGSKQLIKITQKVRNAHLYPCAIFTAQKTLIISVNSTKLMFLRQYQMTTALTEFVSTVNGTKTRRS